MGKRSVGRGDASVAPDPGRLRELSGVTGACTTPVGVTLSVLDTDYQAVEIVPADGEAARTPAILRSVLDIHSHPCVFDAIAEGGGRRQFAGPRAVGAIEEDNAERPSRRGESSARRKGPADGVVRRAGLHPNL
jgi:hypothetical protein